jgi:putative membrane protein
MLAAGVTHTFLDVVPALTFGVPDAAMAASALPGHRLVLGGRGREALRLSVVGSTVAVVAAMPLALPVTKLMTAAYPTLQANLTAILGTIALTLVATEETARARFGGGLALAASGALGWYTLDLSPSAPLDAGGILAPLFAGLFGAPVLLDAMRGGGVPPQDDTTIALSRRLLGRTALGGTLAGASVAYLPGVSSAIAATGALIGIPDRAGERGFIVATSAVNTANTVFALFALVALGTPRTGVLVALNRAKVPVAVPTLLAAVALAAAVAAVAVVVLGDRYLRVVGALDYTRVSVAVLAALVVLSALFAGLTGVAAFLVATVVGLLPPRFGARRVHLMGVLLVPIALGL